MSAPFGNTNAAKGRRWADAIDRALAKKSKAEGIEELDRLAEEFLKSVEAEGVSGYRELGDRMDGKPHQSISGTDGGPLTIQVVRFADDKAA